MKRAISVALGLLIVAGIGFWLSQREPAPVGEQQGVVPGAADTSVSDQSDNNEPRTGDSQSEQLRAARQRVADATLAVQAAADARKAAELEMQRAEVEVAELERWVAGIEERGEDPVDYADEGLARLQPAFFAYQDAFDRFELAEAMEAEASEELAAANEELSALLPAHEAQE